MLFTWEDAFCVNGPVSVDTWRAGKVERVLRSVGELISITVSWVVARPPRDQPLFLVEVMLSSCRTRLNYDDLIEK